MSVAITVGRGREQVSHLKIEGGNYGADLAASKALQQNTSVIAFGYAEAGLSILVRGTCGHVVTVATLVLTEPL
jgi:hypothetical protein